MKEKKKWSDRRQIEAEGAVATGLFRRGIRGWSGSFRPAAVQNATTLGSLLAVAVTLFIGLSYVGNGSLTSLL